MPKFDLILYPANLLLPGDEIVTVSARNPSQYTVTQVRRLTFCYEIICEPYRRFLMQPTDGLWIQWTHQAAIRGHLRQGASS